MIFLRVFIFSISVFFISSPSYAVRFSGDYLMKMCITDENGREYTLNGSMVCQAYIAGLLDYHNLLRSLGTAPGIDFCVPDDVGLNEMQVRVASYIFKKQQNHGAFIASPGVALALFDSYPCK